VLHVYMFVRVRMTRWLMCTLMKPSQRSLRKQECEASELYQSLTLQVGEEEEEEDSA